MWPDARPWRSPRRGGTSGSAPSPTVICKRPAPTTPAGGSTSTTRAGASAGTRRSSCGWWSSPSAYRVPASSSPITSRCPVCPANGCWAPPSGSSTSGSSGSAARSTPTTTAATGWRRSRSGTRTSRVGRSCSSIRAKSGQERLIAVADDAVLAAVTELRRRRGGGPELLAYRDGRRWRDVSSGDINSYVKSVIDDEVSAKDFRTWHGTVLAAVALAESDGPTSERGRTGAVRAAMSDVAEYLGNTPRIAGVVRGSPGDRPLRTGNHHRPDVAPPAQGSGDVDRERVERCRSPPAPRRMRRRPVRVNKGVHEPASGRRARDRDQ